METMLFRYIAISYEFIYKVMYISNSIHVYALTIVHLYFCPCNVLCSFVNFCTCNLLFAMLVISCAYFFANLVAISIPYVFL